MVFLRVFFYKISVLFPFLSNFFQLFYHWNFFLFKKIHGKKALFIFPRRGFLRGEIQLALSDIDVLYIFPSGSDLKRHIKGVERYRYLYPLVTEVEYMDETVFDLWMRGSEIRALEFRAHLLGSGVTSPYAGGMFNNALEVNSPTVLFISGIKECFNLYHYLINVLGEKSNTIRKYSIEKHLTNIHQVISFCRTKNWSDLFEKRALFFEKKLKKREGILEDYLKTIFFQLNLFCEEFIGFLQKTYGVNFDRYKICFDYEDKFFFQKKIIFTEQWQQPSKGEIPLSRAMFLAVRGCSSEEHEMIHSLIKSCQNKESRYLGEYYFQRVYMDIITGGVCLFRSNTKWLLYCILVEIFHFKDFKKEFESEFNLDIERDLNSQSPLTMELGISVLHFFTKHYQKLLKGT